MDSAVGREKMLVLENDVMVPVDMQAENKNLPDYRLSEESRNAIYDSLQNHIAAALLDLSNACQKMEFDKSQAEVLLKESEIEKAKLQTRVTELEIEKSKLEMEIEKSKLESRLTELGIEKSKLERHVKELETEKLQGETHIKELEARKQESSSVAVDSSIVQKLEQEVVSFREKVTSKDKELMGVRRQMAENREHYGDQCRETEKRVQIATLKAEENLRLAQLHEKDAEEKALKLAKCKNCVVRLHERVGGLNALLEKHNIEIPEDLGTSIEE